MKTCEKFGNYNIKGACRKSTNSSTLYYQVVQKIEPPLSCPALPGNYTIHNYESDSKVLTYLPLDGFVYNVVAKLISTDPATKKRLVASCVKAELKVEKIRVKN